MQRTLRHLLGLLLLAPLPHAAAQSMYFAGNGNGSDPIYKADTDGSNVTEIVTGLSGPQDLEVDAAAGKLYWTDNGKVQRSSLDGSNVEDIVTGLTIPRGLAVDAPNGHVYWTSTVTGTIERANLDGTGKVVLVPGLNAPVDVKVDTVAGRLFWTDINASRIESSDLSGGNIQLVLAVNALSIDLDRAGQRLYYTQGSNLGVVNYDGSGVQTLATGLGTTDGIALDLTGSKLYWTDRTNDLVQRADLDGSNVEDLVVGGPLDTILDVELDGGGSLPAAPYCFGDGGGTPCPCGNTGAAGAGCANGSFAGALLGATGSASVANDTLAFQMSGVPPGQPGLLFQGDNALNGGDGSVFGDGLRCAGGAVVRLEVLVADGGGGASSSVPIAATGGVGAGETKRYQHWYRDPAGSPCGAQFNLSNGLEVAWAN